MKRSSVNDITIAPAIHHTLVGRLWGQSPQIRIIIGFRCPYVLADGTTNINDENHEMKSATGRVCDIEVEREW
jgi:hypothetical protein